MLSIIFKTNRDTKETTIAGQTTNASVPESVSRLAKKTTGEPVKYITGGGGAISAHTENHVVDFVEKEAFGGKSPFQSFVTE